MEKENTAFTSKLPDEISITKYENLTYTGTQNGNEVKVWSKAFQKTMGEHEIFQTPANSEPYYIDNTIIILSNVRIEAEDGTIICQMKGIAYKKRAC